MRILFIGDVVAKPGRKLVAELLPALRQERGIDFVVANAENAAHGKGLTSKTATELFQAGIDVLTGGNHSFRNREIYKTMDADPRILRPANFHPDSPVAGRGFGVFQAPGDGSAIGILNLQGRVFMADLDCPFRTGQEIVQRLRRKTPLILVDMHAEATSEKRALKWHLDGQVTAVIGTHTHVATADAEISDRGTAYQTDVGMTGAHDSVLGIDKDIILHQMIHHLPVRHEPAVGDPRLNGLLLEADPQTGRALDVERISIRP